MQDFTLTTYKKLLQELLANGYSFQTLQDFIQKHTNSKTVKDRGTSLNNQITFLNPLTEGNVKCKGTNENNGVTS
jgi:acyl-coenzyme A thioesterase PaaI-like protein